MALRKAAVAGRFYPSNVQTLKADLDQYLSPPQTKIKARGILVPHAGYMYSGHVAGAVFSRVEIPCRIIILSPNHTGMGAPLSIMSSGQWEIPLGKVEIDADLCKQLMRHCHLLTEDAEAHKFEHSLEVQLPFIHYLKAEARFVPITVGASGFATLERLGRAIADTVRELEEDVLVVASSDMNHYEADAITRDKDHQAIERILALDPKGLYETVKSQSISMCGYGPTIAMLFGIQTAGVLKAELIKYATSGEINQDMKEVVGYAGIAIYQE